MLDYKDIITKHYLLEWSGAEIARQTGVSKSGVNDFLKAFRESERIAFPLPEGITNYGVHELVYGHAPGSNTRNAEYVFPDPVGISISISPLAVSLSENLLITLYILLFLLFNRRHTYRPDFFRIVPHIPFKRITLLVSKKHLLIIIVYICTYENKKHRIFTVSS